MHINISDILLRISIKIKTNTICKGSFNKVMKMKEAQDEP